MTIDPLEPVRRPDNLNATIWRYMPVKRLAQLLNDRAVYFCRADQFDDPYEGLFPDDFLSGPDAEAEVRHMLCYRAQFYASCWHMSEVESATMWKLFANRGVVIRSSFSRLEHAFPEHQAQSTNGLERIHVGLVQYDTQFLHPRRNTIKFILHKLPHFGAESEVRAFFYRGHPQAQGYFCDPRTTPISDIIKPTKYVFDVGYPIRTEPSQLITQILVEPLAEDSLFEQVKEIVASSGQRIPVSRSSLHRVEYLEQMLIRERLRNG